MVFWEENICFSEQIRDFPPSIIIVFALPEPRVSGESVRQHYIDPAAHQIHHLACSSLIMQLSGLPFRQTHLHIHTHSCCSSGDKGELNVGRN